MEDDDVGAPSADPAPRGALRWVRFEQQVRGPLCRALEPVRIEESLLRLQHVEAQLALIQPAQEAHRHQKAAALLRRRLSCWREGHPRVKVTLALFGAEHSAL